MDMLTLGLSIVLLVAILILVWQFMLSRKKLLTVSDELQFFKKEKEYYEEAMMLLSTDYRVVFANQAAKELFSLNEQNEIHGVAKKIQLQISSGMREDFFEALEKLNNTNEDSFKLENVFLIVSGQEKKVNIFID